MLYTNDNRYTAVYTYNVYITEQHNGNKSNIKAHLSDRALDSGCMTRIC